MQRTRVQHPSSTVGSIPQPRTPGRHGEAKDPEKVLEVNWPYKTLRHSLRTKKKEDVPVVIKMTKVAPVKERVNILVHLLNSSTMLGTRFSTSTTRRDLDSVSFSKADLVRNRIAGSTTTVQVATKWVCRTTIAHAWLTSELGPQLTLDWSRSLPTWWRNVEIFAAYCWSHPALSMVLSFLEGWSPQQNWASWSTAFLTKRWMDTVFCP